MTHDSQQTQNLDKFSGGGYTCFPSERLSQCFTNPPFSLLPTALDTVQSDQQHRTYPLTGLDVSHSTLSVSGDLSLDAESIQVRIIQEDSVRGIKFISSGSRHTLLLTYSGQVYGWGNNNRGQVLYNGPQTIKSPIKLSLTNIISISAAFEHSLAISSNGNLYGWDCNLDQQINMSTDWISPVSSIDIPYSIKEVYGGFRNSFALTHQEKVVKWGGGKSFELMEELHNIVYLSVEGDSLIAVDSFGHHFYSGQSIFSGSDQDNDSVSYCDDVGEYFTKTYTPITLNLFPRTPIKGSALLVSGVRHSANYLFIIDTNGVVWKFDKGNDEESFNNNPTKVLGLSNIVSISGCGGIFASLDNNGKVFVWGELSIISDIYEDVDQPRCIEALTNIEGISVGHECMFFYSKNTVWAWGRNDKGQLGTGDLIDRPQPVKVFVSEVLGSFQYPKQPLDRMFSGLIKYLLYEYLNYLKMLFGNYPYVKARFYLKCSISKKVGVLAKEVFNVHPIRSSIFLKDPEAFYLDENVDDLQLRLTTDYKVPKAANSRINKLDVNYDLICYDTELFSLFPNVEVAKFVGSRYTKMPINMAHLSKLKCLVLDFAFNIEKLPTSLVTLVLQNDFIQVTDLSYLTSLKELVVLSCVISDRILPGKIPLPQSIATLELRYGRNFSFGDPYSLDILVKFANLKELVIDNKDIVNITEQNFPSLKFIQLIKPDEDSLLGSRLSPTKLSNQGLIKSVTISKNDYLVELSCFPWWIKYSAERYLIDIFSYHVDEGTIGL
ncbi:hypothetical protein P9112_013359 [Eukaryota sp. TZLM1-RC]